ncbi:MAG: potassium channel protein [Verrucomicrobiaceae bacterium]|nr:MAG: potassium channel protein [Verrucomicrobiaceae bacterium]
MKLFTAQLSYFVRQSASRRNVRLLLRFLSVLAGMVVVFSVLFHLIMQVEGKDHTWITGFYWTLTVMSTLGFGDITFTSDLGRVFSIVVLMSGLVFLLILLPFTFIEFFYAPWMQAQAEARAPRELAASASGHVILTAYDPVSTSLIRKLTDYGYPYVLLVGDLNEALQLHDLGIKVLFGEVDRPETYSLARVNSAAMVAATGNDYANTNIAFTVREMSDSVPIVTTVASNDSVDILTLAGSSNVLQLAEMMGQSLARRVVGVDARAHVIGTFGEIMIAEATAAGTPLDGRTLAESQLRKRVGVNVLGMWKRGTFEVATAETKIDARSILLLAGSEEQLRRYDELFCIYHVSNAPVIIIGGGRVGRATAKALEEREVDYRLSEAQAERIRDPEKYIHGNAADISTLEKAGIKECPAIIITSHDDDLNIYLTIYCRRLRPDAQIISRAVRERNVSTLHRAGADFVLSYALMGATSIFNYLRRTDVLMVAEGLHVCETRVPPALGGKTLAEAAVMQKTGCSVVALETAEGLKINPPADEVMVEGERLLLICPPEAEQRFMERYGTKVSGVARQALP